MLHAVSRRLHLGAGRDQRRGLGRDGRLHPLGRPGRAVDARDGVGVFDQLLGDARFSIPAERRAQWAARLRSEKKKVGVVWAANPTYPNHAVRSVPAHRFLPLTRLARVQCWSLQVGPAAAQIPEGMGNLSEELIDFAETAAAISELDLVITVDTAVAHLAGSLRKPVWVLLPYASDWRWMMDREDTPWYSSMRLFRQTRPGEWGDVVERAMAELGR